MRRRIFRPVNDTILVESELENDVVSSSCYCWWSCSGSSTVHEKRKGRPTLAEAALKLDKLQEIEKLKLLVV